MEITEYLPVDFRTQMEAETLCGAEETGFGRTTAGNFICG